MTDLAEIALGTDPANADTDGDGINDYDEIHVYNTDPNNADSDGDGYSDGYEIANGTDPTDPESTAPPYFALKIAERTLSYTYHPPVPPGGTQPESSLSRTEVWIPNTNSKNITSTIGFEMLDGALAGRQFTKLPEGELTIMERGDFSLISTNGCAIRDASSGHENVTLNHKRVWLEIQPAPKTDFTFSFAEEKRTATADESGYPEELGDPEVEVRQFIVESGENTSKPFDILPAFEENEPGAIEITMLPVWFTVYADTEAGPDLAHLMNLDTRQNEEAEYGDFKKCVAHLWESQTIDLLGYLDGSANSGTETLFRDKLRFREQDGDFLKVGSEYSHEFTSIVEPAENKITAKSVEVLHQGSPDVLDRLVVTVVPEATHTNFQTWNTDNSGDDAWLEQLPPMFSNLEVFWGPGGGGLNILRPDRNFPSYIYREPSDKNTRMHPDGYYEMRSQVVLPGKYGHQIFYDDFGAVIEKGISAGSADKAAAFAPPVQMSIADHVHADVWPFVWALQLDGNPCENSAGFLSMPVMHEGAYFSIYSDLRPSIPNSKPQLPSGAAAP